MNKEFQSYYTNSHFITDYMVKKLDLKENDTILEPSVGEGVFVDKILSNFSEPAITIFDIDQYAIDVVSQKYRNFSNISVHKSNTLLDINLDFLSLTNNGFDKVIGNPPYGAVFSKEVKSIIDKKYSDIYAKESYVLFLKRCLSLLKENGKLVFIIPDTFLYLNLHKKFRKHLFNNYKVEEIALFSSKLFPGVSFAYSNLCIITIKNSKSEIPDNEISVFNQITNEEDFINIEESEHIRIKQADILSQENCNLLLNTDINHILKNPKLVLGDIANCVTGIYTGNNKKYIQVISPEIRNAKGYNIIDKSTINIDWNKITGIDTSRCFIPIVKGSIKQAYFSPPNEWFIDWSVEAIRHYNTDRKARFQNSSYYFESGIAIPMLKSKVIRAAIMDGRVFDQSIVGIFPKDIKHKYFILALLNTEIVNDIIHNINPTVNNSANYMKRIPVPKCPEETLMRINNLVEGILFRSENNKEEIEQIFESLYKK